MVSALDIGYLLGLVFSFCAGAFFESHRKKIRLYFRRRSAPKGFWSRQGTNNLSRLGIFDEPEMFYRLPIVEDKFCFEMIVQIVSFFRAKGILNFIDQNPNCTFDQIIKQGGLNIQMTNAALRVLVASGILISTEKKYKLSKSSKLFLLEQSPFFEWDMIRSVDSQINRAFYAGGGEKFYSNWVKGQSFAPEWWAAEMHRLSFPLGFALHESNLLKDSKNILDVAGGAGSVSIALALKKSAVNITLLELPGSIQFAQKMISLYGVSHLIRCVEGNMFAMVWPKGFDTLIFTNIFHDWDDAQCKTLALNGFKSLEQNGRIVVIEALLQEDGPGPLWTECFSFQLAYKMKGRQFKGSELTALLTSCGFDEIKIIKLSGNYSAVVGVKPSE